MPCEICGMIGGHHTQCPHYLPPVLNHHCSICKEGIKNGEDYIVVNGEYAHWECVDNLSTRKLLNWLDISIEEMESDNY